jgi:iron complex outermembrane receptor protein
VFPGTPPYPRLLILTALLGGPAMADDLFIDTPTCPGSDRHTPETIPGGGPGQHDRARQRADPRQRRPRHPRTAAPGAGHDDRLRRRQPAHGQLPRQQRQRCTAHAGADRWPLGVPRRPGHGGLERHPGGHGGYRAHRGVPRPQHRQLRRQRADGGGQHPHPQPRRQPRHAAEGDPRPGWHQRLYASHGFGWDGGDMRLSLSGQQDDGFDKTSSARTTATAAA